METIALTNIPRQEYPRPQFQRENWLCLNGQWNFQFDDNNVGLNERWYDNPEFSMKIIVPYTYQCQLSQINNQDFHDIIWYSRSFSLSNDLKGKNIILNFGAVDYKADVWINGYHVTTHDGGHVPFKADITRLLNDSDNNIVVRAEDYTFDLELPRGKQYWKRTSEGIFYTRTTGIWQTVWLEGVADINLDNIYMTPDIDNNNIKVEYNLAGMAKDVNLNIKILLEGFELINDNIHVKSNKGKRDFHLDSEVINQIYQGYWLWSPENPVLFDIEFTLICNNTILDHVKSYFGMRKISIVQGRVMLNNSPYYQKLLLDQGYWEKSLLTAPTDDDFVKDIELSKEMGFNGVRKHQKVEDPRYLYWADKLGFLVWGEMPNAYNYSRKYVTRMNSEWIQIIERDYNHPSIIAWTPINESWGVNSIMNNKDEQAHATSMYWITKSLDQSRLVISNDGWEHTKTDLLTIHDYESNKEILRKRYSSEESIVASRHCGKGTFAEGWNYEGQPIIVSEMGGISYEKSQWKGWGYSTATSNEDFIQRYNNIVTSLLNSPIIQGFCYTQITDVEQEINGLLTYERKPKVDLEIIKKINEGKWK